MTSIANAGCSTQALLELKTLEKYKETYTEICNIISRVTENLVRWKLHNGDIYQFRIVCFRFGE